MKILVDMNLSPAWVDFFSTNGIDAVHWMELGPGDADDATVLAWARDHGHIVFTHDLDFSALIALAGSNGPSVSSSDAGRTAGGHRLESPHRPSRTCERSR